MKLLTQVGLGLVSALFGLSAQATCLHVPKSGMPAIFKGTTCTATATNVIAATVPSITPQNTVQQIPMPPNVAPPPLSSLKNIGVPSGPAAGFLYAFAGDNLSQGTPTSSPPPAPQPVCSCGGYAGTVYWSGWDSIGWQTTPGGCYACPPPATNSLPANFCPAQGCTVGAGGAICNQTQCAVGNGQIATIGVNGFRPTLTNQTVSQSAANTAFQAAQQVANTTGAASCTTAQVTSQQCKPLPKTLVTTNADGTKNTTNLTNFTNNINSGNASGAAQVVTGAAQTQNNGGGATLGGGTSPGIGGTTPLLGG